MSDFVAKPKPIDKEKLEVFNESFEALKQLIAEGAKGAHNENAMPDEKSSKDKFAVFCESVRALKALIDENKPLCQ